MYDLIVIGGGPGGYMAAERAGHAGLNVLLIEKRALGGVCLNEGCIPSKTLLHSAKVFDNVLHGDAYGVNAENVSFDHSKVLERKNKVVKKLVASVNALMRQSKVTVVSGEAVIRDKNSVAVGDEIYNGKYLIIATGSEPIVPPNEGLSEGLHDGRVLTSREILDLEDVPEKLAIIGGGVVGLEMASYFNTIGSKVTVIEMLPKIAGTIDNEISQMLLDGYMKKGIEFLLETKAAAFTEKGVKIENKDSSTGFIETDKVLLSIGRKPVIEGFGLENTEVLTERGTICVDNNCLTNIPNIYAVGDVNGKYMLAHAAYREAEVAVNHILGKRDVMRYDAVPSVIYTYPEVACVGETEETAKEKGIDYQSVSVPIAFSGRFVAENERADGVCKVIIGKEHRNIIGVHILGSYASEIITAACTMIEMQMRVEDIKRVIFPHPTVAELIREAAFKL